MAIMSVLHWLATHFSNRGKALSRYKRGMARARKHDHQGAIEDYTAAVDVPGAPSDVIAMVLYNRALVHITVGDERKFVDDLHAVLAMDQAPANIKTVAKQKLAKRQSRSRKNKTVETQGISQSQTARDARCGPIGDGTNSPSIEKRVS